MAAASEWRVRSRRVIEAVLASLPADADARAKRRALRDAYPYSERSGWAYQCWLKELRRAVPAGGPGEPARVDWVVRASPTFYVRVACGWCGSEVGPGCLACGRLREALDELDANKDLKGLMAAVRADPDSPLPRLVLADWLAERGYDRLEELFRGTCEV